VNPDSPSSESGFTCQERRAPGRPALDTRRAIA
jgi:hypothetical protein